MAGSSDHLSQTIGGHIAELRGRLTKVALLFILGACVGYGFHDYFIETLKQPLNEKIYYTSPAGGFNFVMKICLVFGLVVALPALVYNLIEFIRPAFKNKIKKRSVRLVSLLSLVLALAGGVFAFLVVVPMSLKFFQHFTEGVTALLSANDYLSFVINCVISFMVIFQAPLIVLFIDHIKPLTPSKLFQYEKHVIVGSLAAALILPFTYDPMTQFLIAIPIIALYNLSILFIAINHAGRKRAARKNRKPAAAAKEYASQSSAKVPDLNSLKPKPPIKPAVVNVTAQHHSRPARHMDIIPRARLAAPTYNRPMPVTEAE